MKTYGIHDLGPKGRQRALEWARENHYGDCDDLAEKLEESLYEDHGVRYNCKVWYSLNSCQGDGVAFDAQPYLSEMAEKDETLAALLKTATVELAVAYNFALDPDLHFGVIIKHDGHYHHSNSMDVSIQEQNFNDGAPADALWTLGHQIRDHLAERVEQISLALEKMGYAEIEYFESDEAVAEALEDNDVEFNRKGEPIE